MIVDTSFVVALMDRGDDDHTAVTTFHAGYVGALVTSPLALAEMDHLVRVRAGRGAQNALYDQLDRGSLRIEWWPSAIYETLEIAAEHGVGLADASLVVLAARRQTVEIGTLDQRDFRRLRPLTGEPAFTLLPADAAV